MDALKIKRTPLRTAFTKTFKALNDSSPYVNMIAQLLNSVFLTFMMYFIKLNTLFSKKILLIWCLKNTYCKISERSGNKSLKYAAKW